MDKKFEKQELKKQKFQKHELKKYIENIAKGFGEIAETMIKNQEKREKQQALLNALYPSQHFQKTGMAHYDDGDKFLFTPDNPVASSIVPFRGMGVAQLLSDGTFDFIRRPRLRTQSQLIRKLAHGRVSKTKDGAIQLTLKVFQDEGVNISEAIAEEALIAKQAIVDWQMKR